MRAADAWREALPLLYEVNVMALEEKARWLSQVAGVIFLVIHAYMRGKFIFESGDTAGMLLLISMVAAALTLVFGVIS